MPKPLLIRRPSGLYVRLLVPLHLRPLVGSRYIVRSLAGLRGDAARLAAARLGYAYGLAWERGQSMPRRDDDDDDMVSLSGSVPDGETAPASRSAWRGFELRRDAAGAVLDFKTDGSEQDNAAALRALELLATPALPALPARKVGPRLGVMADTFMAQFRHAKRAKGTVLDTATSLRLLRAVVGDDVPVSAIGNEHADALRALLPRLPPNASKRKAYRGLTPFEAADLAEKRGDAGLSFRTQEKHLDRLRVFFGWLLDRGDIDRDPFRRAHVLTRKADEEQSRRSFTPAELALIFDPERRAGLTQPAQWWGPLVALTTGARASEIAQLWTDDLEEIGGIWGIHFAPRHHGQHSKNTNSMRFVPVPPALLEAGLLTYRDEVAGYLYRDGLGPLWPTARGVAIPGDSLGDWFNRTMLRKGLGITDPRVVFHSFRHSFTSRGERCGLSDPRISRLSGHAGVARGSVLRKHYIDPATLPERAADMARITWPDLPPITAYQPGQFKAHLHRALLALAHARAKARRGL